MAILPAISVSECDSNTPLLVNPMSNSTALHRSSSVKPSLRSTGSRITLVGYDTELEPKIGVMYGITSDGKQFSWLDHLLAVFCIQRRPKIEKTTSERSPEPEDREVHLDSPWVLPVYVLSTERDEYRHLIPKEAKCTIDTGNLQGNIVSRAFAVDVLGYSEASFHKLTKEEEDGGAGITGHKLIPNGAIYLTWYHSNSTRVFRDMRFLISEHPMYDLIIGARSIRKHHILDVPNLVSDGGNRGRIDLKKGPRTLQLDAFETEMVKANQIWMNFKGKVEEDDDETPESKTELVEKENKFNIAKEAYENELQDVYESHIQQEIQKGNKDEVQRLQRSFKWKTGRDIPPKKEKDHQD